jgi:hypothetical protein
MSKMGGFRADVPVQPPKQQIIHEAASGSSESLQSPSSLIGPTPNMPSVNMLVVHFVSP